MQETLACERPASLNRIPHERESQPVQVSLSHGSSQAQLSPRGVATVQVTEPVLQSVQQSRPAARFRRLQEPEQL